MRMPKNDHIGSVWAQNTLQRVTRHGHQVYVRAMSRKVNWPSPPPCKPPNIQEHLQYTSIDDAFSSVLGFMCGSTRQCKKYFHTNASTCQNTDDRHHTARFHSPEFTPFHYRHPLETTENIRVLVNPGTYSVTAGAWGSDQHTTHVVSLAEDQTINLDFAV